MDTWIMPSLPSQLEKIKDLPSLTSCTGLSRMICSIFECDTKISGYITKLSSSNHRSVVTGSS